MPDYEGRVVRKLVSKGSKSEHQALVLETSSGDFILRTPEGNAFQRDPQLEAFEGERIRVSGRQSGTTLIVTMAELLTRE